MLECKPCEDRWSVEAPIFWGAEDTSERAQQEGTQQQLLAVFQDQKASWEYDVRDETARALLIQSGFSSGVPLPGQEKRMLLFLFRGYLDRMLEAEAEIEETYKEIQSATSFGRDIFLNVYERLHGACFIGYFYLNYSHDMARKKMGISSKDPQLSALLTSLKDKKLIEKRNAHRHKGSTKTGRLEVMLTRKGFALALKLYEEAAPPKTPLPKVLSDVLAELRAKKLTEAG